MGSEGRPVNLGLADTRPTPRELFLLAALPAILLLLNLGGMPLFGLPPCRGEPFLAVVLAAENLGFEQPGAHRRRPEIDADEDGRDDDVADLGEGDAAIVEVLKPVPPFVILRMLDWSTVDEDERVLVQVHGRHFSEVPPRAMHSFWRCCSSSWCCRTGSKR